jgi:hypothetical protein
MDEDLRIIAQCTDLDRMHHAITTFPGSIVLFAASLRPDLTRLRMLLRYDGQPRHCDCREQRHCRHLSAAGISRGGVSQREPGNALVECVRRVAAGETWLPPQLDAARFARRRYGGHARPRPADAQGDAHCGADRAGLQESRDRHPAEDHRAGDQELPALHLRQDRASATGWNWRCSPFTTGCWRRPPPKCSFSATLLACVNRYR